MIQFLWRRSSTRSSYLCGALMLAGCGVALADVPTPDTLTEITPVYLDAAFTREERAEIEAGFDAWNYALHGSKVFVLEGIVQHPGAREDLPRNAVTVDRAERPPTWAQLGVVGWVSDIGSPDIHLLPNDRMREVVLHEIGHSLGAVHASGLMSPTVQPDACIDRETIAQIARAQHFNVYTLRETCQ